MAKRISLRRVRTNQPYTVDELADAVAVTPPTVRGWIDAGLTTIDGDRPAIIMGFHALKFLKQRQSSIKQPMAPDEFYCFRCKVPRRPSGLMADYVASPTGGRLVALCEVCEGVCNRRISAAQLVEIAAILDIASKPASCP